jgi:hypothetical protein
VDDTGGADGGLVGDTLGRADVTAGDGDVFDGDGGASATARTIAAMTSTPAPTAAKGRMCARLPRRLH